MALYQAITIACRYATSGTCATAYRECVKEWLGTLQNLYPHTITPKTRTDPHVSLHVYDFMHSFGPVVNWWAFPTERLIGELGKINSNDHLGGQHEATIMNTWIRSANLRRWINRPGCPAALREFYRLFTLHLGLNLGDRNPPVKSRTKSVEHRPAHYQYDGVNYSRAQTHLGNSLILYLDDSGKTWAGSIEEIIVNANGKDEVRFNVRHQAPLPKGKNDPFRAFPHFLAATYSSKMSDTVVSIDPNSIVSHYARYNFSEDRAVILNLSRDHGSPSAMRSASLSQDKCGLPVTQIPEREPLSRTAICALDEVLPNLRSAHVKVVGLLFNEASDGITIGFPFKSCQYSPHLSLSIERAAKHYHIQSQPLKTPVGSVSEVLRTFASRLAAHQCRNFIQNSKPRLGGGFIVLGGLAGLVDHPVCALAVPAPSPSNPTSDPLTSTSSTKSTAAATYKTSMSSVTERLSLGNLATAVLATAVLALVAAALVLATLVLALRIVRAPVPTGQLFRYHCARVGLRLVFTSPPTLAQIGMLPPLARMAALVEFGGRFANEGWGAVYVTAVVEDYFLGLFYSGQIDVAEFLNHIRVKVGHTADLTSRRKRYTKCNFRQTHFWLFCFRPQHRKVTERMCHVCFDMKDNRAFLHCSCHVVHGEYWWLQKVGGFGEVEACVRRVLHALGESAVPRENLGDAWMASLWA
ncbi:hypothetical protein DFH07DRAFT_951571 [Mycena maculata]|uniref:Uncharacterized protein n=1 Tax=Mycena maculata TaxID=230809 RepID=A0AAD7K591_9AGAR|nr:hypothetical protein DFH07DRAFT_951571 [Mycena maculata]